VRGWLAFLGPWDQGGTISTSALGAISDLLRDMWNMASASPPGTAVGSADDAVRRAVHTAIKGVSQDLESFRFNTVISKLMILRNELKRLQPSTGSAVWEEAMRCLVLLAAPVFPHLAEELWTSVRGWEYSVHRQRWPAYDEELLAQAQVTMVVQVNGKVRDQLVVDADLSRDETRVKELVLALPKIQQLTNDGASVQRVIVVPGKLVNVVAR
jgi:leucyl-tRNA synthetase